MYNILQSAHSGWAYIALILLVIATATALIGLISKKAFNLNHRRISLMALIAVHLQFVAGMFLYFTSPNGWQKIQSVGISGMQTAERLLCLEHPVTNLIAITLITIGWSKHKKAAPEKKFKAIGVFYLLGLILILVKLPWSSWLP
jgi:hypothetical protein